MHQGTDNSSPVVAADTLTAYWSAGAIQRLFRSTTGVSFDVGDGGGGVDLGGSNIYAAPSWISLDSCRLYYTAHVGSEPSYAYLARRSPVVPQK
jgi:hypothetical protein